MVQNVFPNLILEGALRRIRWVVGREGEGHLHKHRAMDIKVKLGRSLFRNIIIAREGGFAMFCMQG